MTVTTTANKITYNANGATASFTFPFSCDVASDIKLIVTDAVGNTTLVDPSLYTVTLNPTISPNPTPVGGTVVYPLTGGPLATGNKVTIYRQKSVVQPNSFTNQGTLYPDTIESSDDDLVMIMQQLQELVGRAFIVAVSDPNPLPLPTVIQRANYVAAFDAQGNMIAVPPPQVVESVVSAAMIPVVSAPTLSQARDAMGLGDAATMDVGTTAGTVAAGDDPRIVGAATKVYVDNQISTVTNGYESADAIVTSSYQAADAAIVNGANATFVKLAGGTMTGPLILRGNPVSALEAATKQYVDANSGGGGGSGGPAIDVSYVPTGGVTSTNVQDAITELDAKKVAKAGDTMTGHLTLPTGPAAPNAVRKDYVDSTVAAAIATVPAPPAAATAAPIMDGTAAVGTGTKYAREDHVHPTDTTRAAASAIPVAATAPEFVSNSAPTKMLTPGAVWNAAGLSNLVDGPTIAPDFSTSFDFIWTLGAAGRTLANPTNLKQGQKGIIYLQQDGTGGRTITTWGGAWKFPGGIKPTLSTAAGAVDAISYAVLNPAGAVVCTFSAGFA